MASRYNGLKQIGKKLESPKIIKLKDKDIGETRLITVKSGERLDNISYDMYNDSSLWWIIAQVNNLKEPYIRETMNLIIPLNPNNIINLLLK